jgi:hypothetical protein
MNWKKWGNTPPPEKFKTRRRHDSHDVRWNIGKKRYGSTIAERDTINTLLEDYGDYISIWGAWEEDEIILSPNEAAIIKAIIEAQSKRIKLIKL